MEETRRSDTASDSPFTGSEVSGAEFTGSEMTGSEVTGSGPAGAAGGRRGTEAAQLVLVASGLFFGLGSLHLLWQVISLIMRLVHPWTPHITAAQVQAAGGFMAGTGLLLAGIAALRSFGHCNCD